MIGIKPQVKDFTIQFKKKFQIDKANIGNMPFFLAGNITLNDWHGPVIYSD